MTVPGAHPAIVEAARGWIVRLSSGEISEQELAELADWRAAPGHEDIFQHELALWRSLDAAEVQLATQETGAARSHVRLRPAHAFGAVAAGLALLLAGPEVLLRLRADYRTDAAVQAHSLPDGSRVALDARSAIAVRFEQGERRIEVLRGRAWFEVVHDRSRPFRVSANGVLVEDIGTAFAVSAEDTRSEVAVTGGAVRVGQEDGAGSWLTLTAGQRAAWNDEPAPGRLDPVPLRDLPVGRIAAWRDGDILLEATPVRTAIDEIARYRRGPTLVMGDVEALPAVTAIIRADRADEGLDALAASAGLSITRLPGGLAIVRPVP